MKQGQKVRVKKHSSKWTDKEMQDFPIGTEVEVLEVNQGNLRGTIDITKQAFVGPNAYVLDIRDFEVIE